MQRSHPRRKSPKSNAWIVAALVTGSLAVIGTIAIVVATAPAKTNSQQQQTRQLKPQAPQLGANTNQISSGTRTDEPSTLEDAGNGKESSDEAKGTVTSPLRRVVRDYLDKTERDHTIIEIYAPESLRGATFYSAEPRAWVSFWYVLGFAEGFKGEDKSNFIGALEDGWGVRVRFNSDEGFSRILKNDRIFIIDSGGAVLGSIPTENVRIGKPGDAEEQERSRNALEEFLDPDRLPFSPRDPRSAPDRTEPMDEMVYTVTAMGGDLRVAILNAPTGRYEMKIPKETALQVSGVRAERVGVDLTKLSLDDLNKPMVIVKWREGVVTRVTWNGRPIPSADGTHPSAASGLPDILIDGIPKEFQPD